MQRRWVLDFANILKTFIGSNFLGMPYAFHQAGVYVRRPFLSSCHLVLARHAHTQL
jgi:amino acid permease